VIVLLVIHKCLCETSLPASTEIFILFCFSQKAQTCSLLQQTQVFICRGFLIALSE